VSCSRYYSGTILESSEAKLVAYLGASFGLVRHAWATIMYKAHHLFPDNAKFFPRIFHKAWCMPSVDGTAGSRSPAGRRPTPGGAAAGRVANTNRPPHT